MTDKYNMKYNNNLQQRERRFHNFELLVKQCAKSDTFWHDLRYRDGFNRNLNLNYQVHCTDLSRIDLRIKSFSLLTLYPKFDVYLLMAVLYITVSHALGAFVLGLKGDGDSTGRWKHALDIINFGFKCKREICLFTRLTV